MQASLGDASIAEMNTTRMDGQTYNPDQLLSIAAAMPFLARRRMVILTNPLAKVTNSDAARDKFRKSIEKLPESTMLVLVQNDTLPRTKDKKPHWLERWVDDHPGYALIKAFPPPRGAELVDRIQKQAQAAGGRIDGDAAQHLAQLVDGDLRVAHQEIDKLLAYVNYKRPISFEDVDLLTADTAEGDVFALVDALSARQGQRAMSMLHRLLESSDYYALFGMLARQFRLLIQAREVIDSGGSQGDIQRLVRVAPFVARKLDEQARRFRMPELETAHRRLLEMDEAVKTSKATGELALEFFVSAFTAAPEQTILAARENRS
jgi:DNA polymerase-3 subunit delta